jgi:hypothetical protein
MSNSTGPSHFPPVVRTPGRWTELPQGLELHPERRRNDKRPPSTGDVVGAACRLTRAAGERLAHGNGDLFLLLELERELRRAWATAIAGLRESCHEATRSKTGGRP